MASPRLLPLAALLFLLGSNSCVDINVNVNVNAYVVSPSFSTAFTTSSRIRRSASSSTSTITSTITSTNSPSLLRLNANENSDDNDSSSSNNNSDNNTDIASSSTTSASAAQFGDVMSIKKPSSASASSSSSSAQFGDVMSIKKPSSSAASAASSSPLLATTTTTNTEELQLSSSSQPAGGASATATATATATLSDAEMLKQRRTRNLGVALLSVALAVGNYAYQWTHPVTPIQLLVTMSRSSAALEDIGKNSKPTVIDFWAPWCENCRYMAPTLFQIEETYKDKVNFVMVNADDPNNWPLIEAIGVDAIPHMAMVEADGTIDTALIGSIPKEWLSKDIDVLLDNSNNNQADCKNNANTVNNANPIIENANANDNIEKKATTTETLLCNANGNNNKQTLPYQMLDVFANRPEQRKITNLDVIFDAATKKR